MTIDCHMHLDESIVSVSGLIAGMDAFGIEKTALIASVCPPLSMPKIAGPALVALRRAIHRPGGAVHKAALAMYGNSVKEDGTVDLLGVPHEVKVQPRNDEVLDAVARHPGRLVGWVFVNPAGPVDPLTEVQRCLEQDGMVGVKAHPYWHNYPVSLLMDCAALCQEIGWPMLVHLGPRQNGDFRALPETFPRLKIIYAHAGIPYGPLVCDYARQKPGVHVDLSSAAYVDARIAADAIKRAGADKCLFGADGPYFHDSDGRFDYGPFLDMVDGLGLSPGEAAMVKGGNFERLTESR